MKIQANDIQMGDLIRAYCNNKMQICKVKSILEKDLDIITLFVSPPGNYHKANSRVIRFQRLAMVELHAD